MSNLVLILKSILYGIVEGISEWLPISSTGHLIILEQFVKLDLSSEFMEMFDVVIQLGAILAVVVIFFNKLWPFKKKEIIDKEKLEDDLFLLREKLIEFIQEEKTGGKELGIEEKLLIIYYILLECYENDQYDPDGWLLVPELTNTLDEIEKSRIDTLNECNELMLDLIDNYLKEGVYEKYLLILNEEAVKLEELLETEDELPELEITNLERFNEKWNEYKALMEKALSQEFFGELIIDEDDMEGFLVKYQWIIMEYSLLKHFCYLHYRKYGELNFENIKKCSLTVK